MNFIGTVIVNCEARKMRDEKGRFAKVHGGRNTRLYGVWCAMKERCGNSHNKAYKRYGGRGIRVCEEWQHDFSAFREWAYKNGYKEGLTIDRIDSNGNYEPSNCRWATHKEQNRNYSRNHMITYKGRTQCLSDWADEYGINRTTVLFRIRCGKPLDEVFSPIDGRTTRWKKKTISQN